MTQEEALKKFDESTGWFTSHPIDLLHRARAEFTEYINEVENRTCENCKFYQPETIKGTLFKRCFFLGTVGDIITCGRWEQK